MNGTTMRAIELPDGYTAVRQDDTVHVVGLDQWESGPLARQTPICGRAIACADYSLEDVLVVTCWECVALVS